MSASDNGTVESYSESERKACGGCSTCQPADVQPLFDRICGECGKDYLTPYPRGQKCPDCLLGLMT